tara:strand:- start:637 stop:1932 length:1296 start_codon:yes stop_codon:yes gene_type:complete
MMMSKPTVTLCMIVKDESHIILDCLKSIAPFIDQYHITDTGSTDGTQDLIKNFFEEANIPGEVHQSDWKGFGKSRTESIENAEKSGCDYALIIDADDFVTGDLPIPPIEDHVDGYSLRITRGEFTWWRTQLIKLSSKWHYVGVLHEYASTREKPQPNVKRLDGNYNINARTEGARNVGIDPVEKYSRDAEVLLSALTDPEDQNYEPDNGRYMFYLAQSYFDSQQWEKAEEWYKKRADHGGWGEEVFYSLMRVAMCKAIIGEDPQNIIYAFLEAHNSRPTRAEPLYHIARTYREILEKPALGYIFAKRAAEIPYPEQDILFITDEVYKWQALDELGTCAHSVGDIHTGYFATKKLLEENRLPEEQVERVVKNHTIYHQMVSQYQEKIVAEEQQKIIQEKAEKVEKKKQEKQARKTKVKKTTKQKSRRQKMNK